MPLILENNVSLWLHYTIKLMLSQIGCCIKVFHFYVTAPVTVLSELLTALLEHPDFLWNTG